MKTKRICANCRWREGQRFVHEWAECENAHVANLIDTIDGYASTFHLTFGCIYFEERGAGGRNKRG